MMNDPVLLLVMLNFGAIGLLTAFFFRRKVRYAPEWWATALPHVFCPSFLVVAQVLELDSLAPAAWAGLLDLVSVALSAASLALMFLTWGTHRVPLAHFHQDDDTPEHIVTYGAYARIRHPFYTSYILLYLAAAAGFPHVSTLGLFAYMFVALTRTAAKEERRLAASQFGTEYRRYTARTGRFLPRLTTRTTG